MIDFNNASFMKLKEANYASFSRVIDPILTDGEQVVGCFQSIRDYVVFTSKRIITVNVQGLTGKKQDFTSLPYNKIQAFSVETAGVVDLDSELDLWFAGLGKVRLEFTRATNVHQICKMIGDRTL